MNYLKIALLILPALPAIISDFEKIAADADAKGESLDAKAKQELADAVNLLQAVIKLL